MRVAVRGAAPPRLDSPVWSVKQDDEGYQIEFVWQAPLAITSELNKGLVLALGRISRPNLPANQTFALAFDRNSGELAWRTPISNPANLSFAGVTVDAARGTAIVCTDRWVRALKLDNGEVVWQRQLSSIIVNAMPVITTDLGRANRLFITDYNAYYPTARLYCINVDAFDAASNPYQPGAIVWSAQIGSSSGNSPAYLPLCLGGAGLVYVATPASSVSGYGAGKVMAFHAASEVASPAWETENVQPSGFYGGLAVAPPTSPGGRPRVYAASYAFSGDQFSSNLLSLDGVTGQVVWSVPSNRTSSTPVPLPDRRVLLSSGYLGYGSTPSLQLFREQTNESQTGAQLVWDTAYSTWNDANNNGALEPGEYFLVGSWNEQPVVLTADGRNLVAIGVPPEESAENSPSNGLYLLDIDRDPNDPEFYVACSSAGAAGGSAAVAGLSLASIGCDGLSLFGVTPGRLDVNWDKFTSVDDLYRWESGSGQRDIDRDGSVTPADRMLLIQSLRPTWPGLAQGVLP